MRPNLLSVAMCLAGSLAASTAAQNSKIEGIRVAAGTVLTFHLQTRLNAARDNAVDGLPKDTVLHVKILGPIDSSTDRDGTQFHGLVTTAVSEGDRIVIHSEAEVRGVLALLRSASHPDGFRYELMIISITDRGKTYPLTAALNTSLFELTTPQASAQKETPKAN